MKQFETVQNTMKPGEYYFSGNEAIAEGALAAECDFYAGYPITPSSEIMERMAFRLPELGRTFIQMEDEIASVCSIIGASWAGARALTATSGPGFSLMMEAIGYAAFTETPIVIVDIQRAGPCTGQATRVGSGDVMQAKWGSHGDYQIIALSPWSVQEMYSMTIDALNLAERYRVPVIILGDEAVGHLRERISVPSHLTIYRRKKDKKHPPFGSHAPDGVPPMPSFGEGAQLLITGSTHDEWGFRRTEDGAVHQKLVARLNQKILDHRNEICRTESFFIDDAQVAVVAYGFTARSSHFAVKKLRKEGFSVGLVRLQTLWPFPAEIVTQVSRHVKRILVPEMNMGQIEGEILKVACCPVEGFHQANGEIIHPLALADWIRERML